jgi:hypothetical protein
MARQSKSHTIFVAAIVLLAPVVTFLVAPIAARGAAVTLVRIADGHDLAKVAKVTRQGGFVVSDGSGPLSVDGTVAVDGPLSVASSENDPVIVRDLGTTTLMPLQATATASMVSGEAEKCTTILSVPAGKRLIVEYTSERGSVGGDNYLEGLLRTTVGQSTSDHYLALDAVGKSPILIGQEEVTIYADPLTDVRLCFRRGPFDTSLPASLTLTLSGQLIDT